MIVTVVVVGLVTMKSPLNRPPSIALSAVWILSRKAACRFEPVMSEVVNGLPVVVSAR